MAQTINLKILRERVVTAKKVASDTSSEEECLRDLESLGNNYRAYAIGSRPLGLANVQSDLDVFLDTGNMYDGNQKQFSEELASQARGVARQVSNSLKFQLRSSLLYCRSPIIKVCHRRTGLNCDISFRHGLGVENTRYLLHMMKIAPLLKPMIIFLKNINQAPSVVSYTWYMLVIFYMQQKKYLPSLVQLRPESLPRKQIGGWDCHFSTSTELSTDLVHVKDLLDLIEGFSEFYLKFDFSNKVVCPLTGLESMKSDFKNNGEGLPKEMFAYKNMVSSVTQGQRNENKQSKHLWNHPKYEIFRYESDICVQDMFDLSHNLTKAWNYLQRNDFMRLLKSIKDQCKATRESKDYTKADWSDAAWCCNES